MSPHTAVAHDSLRGFIATRSDPLIRDENGEVVVDLAEYAFLQQDPAPSADAKLWTHSRHTAAHGLFEICPGFYQVRGFDLAAMTLIETTHGVLVLDVLSCNATAAAALELYFQHRGRRPVTAVVITHPHADHFGGFGAVREHLAEDAAIIVPRGFREHAISENIQLGPAMKRRAGYMYGSALSAGPEGHLGCGIGQRVAAGPMSLPEPTVLAEATGERFTVDGLEFEVQLTPGTEAPAEMNLYFPAGNVLCMAENALHSMHNILTLRGAEVRDAQAWSRYLDEALRRYGAKAQVLFATHHWPTWGNEQIRDFLSVQRDLYGYLHDQTVRLINLGCTPREIAEQLVLPPALEARDCAQGFYGSLSHNVKGIYQRYLGWYDANPANLWPLPPQDESRRWVQLLGGAEAALATLRGQLDVLPESGAEPTEQVDTGQLRFAATVLNHIVFAAPQLGAARELLARVYRQLGYSCRNATWRNIYLTGAGELLHGPVRETGGSRIGAGVDLSTMLDVLAVRINAPEAWDRPLGIDLHATDTGARIHLRLSNGVLHHHEVDKAGDADCCPPSQAAFTGPAAALPGALRGKLETVQASGDVAATLQRLQRIIQAPDPGFAIVTP